MPDFKLLDLVRSTANAEGLDVALVCTVVEQESAWNPWAMRYEPLFFAKYVAPLYTNMAAATPITLRKCLSACRATGPRKGILRCGDVQLSRAKNPRTKNIADRPN
jgi:hypothetical protein